MNQRRIVIILLLLAGCASAIRLEALPEEDIVFYPAEALYENGQVRAFIHGKVFENETDSVMRSMLVSMVKPDVSNEEESRNFERRSRLFLVDNQGWKGVKIRIAGRTLDLKSSGMNGHFQDSVLLDPRELPQIGSSVIPFDAVLTAGDKRLFRGAAHIVPPGARIIVSDIDDTIKLSDVRNKNELLKNTFLRPYKPAPGMSALYRQFAASGAFFFYVSASPWQLYPELKGFASMAGYPDGVYRMKYFRLKDTDFFNLFQKPFEYKTETIEPILKALPGHSFILIGDSGEKDPEAYAGLAKKYPQIERVLIRLAYEDEKERLDALAAGLRPGVFTVFRDPASLRL